MKQKLTSRHWLAMAACAALLVAVLVLPLVGMMSYRWTITDLADKLPRLVHSGAVRTFLVVLLAAMTLAPAWLAYRIAMHNSVPRYWRALPFAAALMLSAGLLLSSGPVKPAWGLHLYLAVALALAVFPRNG